MLAQANPVYSGCIITFTVVLQKLTEICGKRSRLHVGWLSLYLLKVFSDYCKEAYMSNDIDKVMELYKEVNELCYQQIKKETIRILAK